MLVRKKIAYAFDEILGGSFDRVLVLMAGGGGAHEDAVLLMEVMTCLGGVLVASDAADMISVDPIELNDLFGGSKNLPFRSRRVKVRRWCGWWLG